MKRYQVLFLAFMLLISIFPANLQAQAGGAPPQPGQRFKFEHLLGNTNVFTVFQDRVGFMWFSTAGGLYKYDGYKTTVYRNDAENPFSLSGNTVPVIYEDRDGVLWVGTDGGLDKFDRQTDQFTHYRHDPADPHSLSHNFVFAIYQDRAGALWIGTLAGGLNKFDPATGTFIRYEPDPNNPHSLIGDDVRAIYEDRSGTLWVGTNGGLNKLDQATGQFAHYRNDPDNPRSLSHNWVMSIYEDQDGLFWIGTRGGFNKFDPKTGQFTRYLNDPQDPTSLSHNTIRGFYVDPVGIFWIGTYAGLNLFDRVTGRFVRYQHDLNDPESLSADMVYGIYADRGGAFWLGTWGGGVNRLDRAAARFALYQHDPANPQSLSHNNVKVFYEDRAGRLWIGTNGGLNRFDRTSGRFIRYQHDPNNPRSLSDNQAYAIGEDRAGMLWVGTVSRGLNQLDLTTGQFTRYQHDPRDPNSLASDDIRAIVSDSDGMLWVGMYSSGLDQLNPATGTFMHYRSDPNDPNSLSDPRILSIEEDRSGLLWIATSNGLNRFDRTTGKFTRYLHSPDNPSSLSSNNVSTVYYDSTGTLWVGTMTGLNKFDPATQSFTHYRVKDGLPSDTIRGILEDNQGNLWISTDEGLSRFNLQTGTFRNYDVRDGLQSNKFNGGGDGKAAYRTRRGELMFGGPNGFNVFYPDQLSDNPYIPPVVLTNFQIFNKPVPIGGKNSPLQKHINETDHITLSYAQSVFSFEFAALNYRFPEKNRYAYRMEGFEKDWNYVDSSRRFATYTNLDPGTYSFRVKASNNDGVWNEAGKAVKITITPPWWQTWWFYTLCVAGVLGIFGLIFWSKANQLRTERTVALALRESEERYRIVSELTSDLAYSVRVEPDGSFGIEWVTAAITRITGFTLEEYEAHGGWQFLPHPEDLPTVVRFTQHLLSGESDVSDFRIITKNGEVRWIRDYGYPVWDEHQAGVVHIIGAVQDVTERKQAKAVLRESEERFRSIFSQSPIGIELYDKEGHLIDINTTCLNMFGVKDIEAVKGFKLFEDPNLPKDAKQRLRNGESVKYEAVFDFELVKQHNLYKTTKSGQCFLECFLTQWGAGTSDLKGFLVHVTDITDRKRAEEALVESELKYRTLFKSMAQGFYLSQILYDEDGIPCDYMYIDVNSAFEHIMGLRREQIIGKTYNELVPPDPESGWPDCFKRVAMTGIPENYIFPSKIYNCYFEVYAFRPEEGKFSALVKDITESKQAEERIKNQNLLLEQAVQEKQREMEAMFERLLRQEKLATIGQIAGSIAHELRNPLGAVKNSVFFLKRLYQKQQMDASNPKVKEHLDLIGSELDISERVISDLLQMTRMKSPHQEQTDLHPIIVDAAEHCHLPEDIHLTIKLQSEPFIIWADPGQLRQVFINILTNAIQAIAQDGNITIKAKQLVKEKSTIIEIENDGLGIEPDALSKIFEPLYTTKATGTGLGLSICKQIIENHQGQISVSSQIGQGTTVTIILPGQDSYDPGLEK